MCLRLAYVLSDPESVLSSSIMCGNDSRPKTILLRRSGRFVVVAPRAAVRRRTVAVAPVGELVDVAHRGRRGGVVMTLIGLVAATPRTTSPRRRRHGTGELVFVAPRTAVAASALSWRSMTS